MSQPDKRLRIGFIGAGNMGGAMLRGLRPHQHLDLVATDHTRAKVEAFNSEDWPGRVEWADSPEDVAAKADIVVLGVKPQQAAQLAAGFKSKLGPDKVLVSIAAGLGSADLSAAVDQICPVVRVMPNLPAVIGKGVFALCLDDPLLGEARRQVLRELFELLGKVVVLPESKFPAFSAVVGCGPAYVCLFMEGMQNAAITLGFSAVQAKELVAATVEGTAALALAGQESFADLRVQVCSPAGMTIYGVNQLERTAVRGNVTDAVIESYKRDANLTGK